MTVSALIPPEKLLIGQGVSVLSKTGRLVDRGTVRSATFGYAVIESRQSGNLRVCRDSYFSFANDDLDDDAVADPTLIGEGSDKSTPPAEGEVDVNSLPPEIKKKVTGIEALSSEQIEDILQSIGDAAVTALRRVGFSEKSLYRLANDIQRSAEAVLSKEG